MSSRTIRTKVSSQQQVEQIKAVFDKKYLRGNGNTYGHNIKYDYAADRTYCHLYGFGDRGSNTRIVNLYPNQFPDYKEVSFEDFLYAIEHDSLPLQEKPKMDKPHIKVNLATEYDVQIVKALLNKKPGSDIVRICEDDQRFVFYDDESFNVTDTFNLDGTYLELTVPQFIGYITNGEVPKIDHTVVLEGKKCVIKPGESIKVGCTTLKAESIERLIKLWNTRQ